MLLSLGEREQNPGVRGSLCGGGDGRELAQLDPELDPEPAAWMWAGTRDADGAWETLFRFLVCS